MIGTLYVLGIGSQAQTTALTLVEILAPADGAVLVERLYIKQTSFDTSENLGTKFEDISTTGTGTASVPRPLMEGDNLFGGVMETNATIEPTYSGNVFLEEGFNVLSGFLWTPANDDEVFCISPSQLAGMNLDVAPSGSMNFSYGCTVREIGG